MADGRNSADNGGLDAMIAVMADELLFMLAAWRAELEAGNANDEQTKKTCALLEKDRETLLDLSQRAGIETLNAQAVAEAFRTLSEQFNSKAAP